MTSTADRPLADYTTGELRALLDAAERSDDQPLLQVLVAELEERLTWRPLAYQQPPFDDFTVWLLLAGRGTGKSDAGAHAMNAHALGPPCDPRVAGGHRMGIVGPTVSDTIDVAYEGPSSLRAHNPEVELVTQRGITIVRWPSGASARIFGAYTPEDAERPRSGGNRCWDWWDEFAVWRQLGRILPNLMLGLRLGPHPRAVASTTPKNRPELHDLVETATARALLRLLESFGLGRHEARTRADDVVVTTAATADNVYLDADTKAALYAQYAGTRLGEQELEGKLLTDVGERFVRAWFQLRDGRTDWPLRVRSWDLAGTEPTVSNEDPDWTAGALVAMDPTAGIPVLLPDGETLDLPAVCIEHVVRARKNPGDVAQLVAQTAREDGPDVPVLIEREPGQSGKSQLQAFRNLLSGFRVIDWSPTGSKETRAEQTATAAAQGRLWMTRGEWNTALLDEHEAFPGGDHDDQVDAVSAALAWLSGHGQAATAERPQAAPLPSRLPPSSLVGRRR